MNTDKKLINFRVQEDLIEMFDETCEFKNMNRTQILIILIAIGYGAFQYFMGETLEERYWVILVSLVALTGSAINYLMSASRAEKTEATKVQE